MTSTSPASSPPQASYSPRSPLLRGLLVLLVAGFVIPYEAFPRLFKARDEASQLPIESRLLH